MEPTNINDAIGWVPMIVKDNDGEHGPGREDEPEQPSWTLLSDAFGQQERLFRNLLFLEGCDLSSNVYLIFGESISIFDPGNDYSAFTQLFELPQFAPRDIRKVVLSHGHPAHANAAMELFRHPDIRNNPQIEVVLHAACPPEIKHIIVQFGARITEVKGGEMLDLEGFEWEVLHAPGHARDCICLYHAQTGSLLTGDTVLPDDGTTGSHKQADEEPDQSLASLRFFFQREIVNILPGHGSPVASSGIRVLEVNYLEVLNRIIGAELENAACWYETAAAAARHGMLVDAVFCCDRAVAENSDNPIPLKLKAFCLNDLGRFETAYETFLLLERKFPREKTDPFTTMGKGHALLGLARYDESLSCFEKILESCPDRKDARIYRAFSLYLSGRMDEALKVKEFMSGFPGKIEMEMLNALGRKWRQQ